MKYKNPKLEWFVFYYDFNLRCITKKNVFAFGDDLVSDLYKAYKKKELLTRADLEAIVERWARYYYWCRAEAEVLISDIFSGEKAVKKVDIYSQLKLNWDIFIDYIIYKMKLELK